MKIYAHQPFLGKNRPQIVLALREAFRDILQRETAQDVLPMDRDREDQFFLKTPDAIHWGRVYFEDFEKHHLELLKLEVEYLSRTFQQPIQPCIFFNKTGMDLPNLLDYPGADYFRYILAHHGVDEAVMLEKVIGSSLASQPRKSDVSRESNHPVSSRREARLPKAVPVTREELADLITLSLELKL